MQIASLFTPPRQLNGLLHSMRVTSLIGCIAAALTAQTAAAIDAAIPPEAELFVLLDTKSALRIANSPDEILKAVAATSKTPLESLLHQTLGSPLKARYLIADRLSAEQIQRLGVDSPRVRLDQYAVLSYASVAAADVTKSSLALKSGIASVSKNARFYFSTTPSDPGFQQGSGYGTGYMNYQWGLQQMNFPAAWDTVKGNAYVAVLDTGIQLVSGPQVVHADLTANFKPQFSAILSGAGTLDDELGGAGSALSHGHGTHVAGIIAANTNNGYGTAGGCWNCALMIQKVSSSFNGILPDSLIAGITAAVDRGAQVINMSFGNYGYENCSGSQTAFCEALRLANSRNVVMVAAAGNNYLNRRDPNGGAITSDVQQPANQTTVIPVGALQPTAGSRGYLWTEMRVSDEFFSGSTGGPSMQNRGVVAPGMDVFSTIYDKENWNVGSFCGDNITGSVIDDGFGPCTGTSMAAPHISALVGLMRSVNPWITSSEVGYYLRHAGDNAASPNELIGWGQPNAATAVASMVATNTKRLIPLLSMYSEYNPIQNKDGTGDRFYTTVPQMALAALHGTLRPRPNPAVGKSYVFIGVPPMDFDNIPEDLANNMTGAQVWVIGTYQNPNPQGAPLRPLIRLSYACPAPGGPSPPGVCANNIYHVDHALSTDTNSEINGAGGFISVGYKIDGVEGYVYDRAYPQPVGTEPLLRAYNATLDDHAVFPLREQCNMAGLGYTLDVVSLGYAYPVVASAVSPQPVAASLLAVKSRKTHGSTGTYDLNLDVSLPMCGLVSVEPRTGTAGHQIVFQFNAPITGTLSATVVDSAGASLGSATASASGNEVIVSLSGVADNKRAKITVTGTDGIVIGTVSMGFLVGDVNNTRSVNASDISAVQARSGQTVDASNFIYDVNISGAVSSSDITAVKARSGLVLPN
ncbi:MAG: S8 family serine peptidase [Betaproteobacteria bacterium]